ncbi:2-oxoisovalerate dehydrogenase [Histoplasma capsulatum G186AR]|uniref:3-methyl-2-oxobutanoate dehydrogenase (2-methylpropanoyl-transferring) n=2 Tax=Ajellomyces capsulatus TaxID=5037 RepID=C0NQJ6_AJECG|nr:2-oxoisovalerate dehydrogenase [Histoplasma capsulatum G186AR]EEH06468.1 2-oxoisovalerate dehydrogenase [Histoplasma capsulatum G186AR]KAG5293070.1 2-oxoisovalerate dehydrogenase [Histoplasma capsulatum]QSS74522.1 2-oxoisovalerate dehydrogenase [Histoplasma capsulatum G186AR]
MATLSRRAVRKQLLNSLCRLYSTHVPSPAAHLNLPINYGTTPLLHHSPSTISSSVELPKSGATKRINLYQSINSALRTALSTSDQVLLFGEDVAFGGVFRCSVDLQTEFGSERVFNTPLTEQGIVGFAIGTAAEGMKPVAEIQFADYVYPAFDQLVNEAAKFRYREGATGSHVGGLVVRMPCGGVGHGALYHSQSPESLFTHIPGLRVVMPRSPTQAKGLLLSSILECNDPVVFMEPKILYRAAVEHVPTEAYTLPLDKADVIKPGKDLTVISYGQPLYLCSAAIEAAEKAFKGVSIELIDLRTLYPWDRSTILESVRKTGRAIVVHESMLNAGIGAEVAATIQEGAFLSLEAPVKRVTGWDIHPGLIYERFNMPDVARIFDAIKTSLEY